MKDHGIKDQNIDNGNITDEELVSLAQNNDEEAIEVLFGRYKDIVRGKANLYFMVGADKDDVNQEGMIGLFKAVGKYEDGKGASFRTFAEHCINNQILNAVERASRHKHEPLNTSIPIHISIENEKKIEDMIRDENEMTPETAILVNEDLEILMNSSDALFSKFEKEVWEEYLKGRDYIEISKKLDKPSKSVDNALQRMKKKIQKMLSSR